MLAPTLFSLLVILSTGGRHYAEALNADALNETKNGICSTETYVDDQVTPFTKSVKPCVSRIETFHLESKLISYPTDL